MVEKMSVGHFNVSDQQRIGMAQNPPSFQVAFEIEVGGQVLRYSKPLVYKFTDPVRGELYQPLVVVPAALVSAEPNMLIFRKGVEHELPVSVKVTANRNIKDHIAHITGLMKYASSSKWDSSFTLAKGLSREYDFMAGNASMKELTEDHVQAFASMKGEKNEWSAYLNVASIRYDHIPPIHYFYQDGVKLLNIDLKTAGKKIGYIEGAGDKVGAALQQMGYEVTYLKEKDISNEYLKQFDAVVTGVRAYNVHEYLYAKYEVLMRYVEEGGNLIVQYNTSNNISNVKNRIAPYPFMISRNRVTDEKAQVVFLQPEHPVLNIPNKITATDFEGWVQERGIYFAEGVDPHYVAPLGMSDAGEQQQKGSLIIADHGKGKFVYTGLVFFRQLPAGIPGAFRLMANIIALNSRKSF
jgi:histidinol phosphatase-like PHP family hydrolase